MYFDMDSTNPQHEIQMLSLGTIFILRKDKGVEGWFRKWQFSLLYALKMSLQGRWLVQNQKRSVNR